MYMDRILNGAKYLVFYVDSEGRYRCNIKQYHYTESLRGFATNGVCFAFSVELVEEFLENKGFNRNSEYEKFVNLYKNMLTDCEMICTRCKDNLHLSVRTFNPYYDDIHLSKKGKGVCWSPTLVNTYCTERIESFFIAPPSIIKMALLDYCTDRGVGLYKIKDNGEVIGNKRKIVARWVKEK